MGFDNIEWGCKLKEHLQHELKCSSVYGKLNQFLVMIILVNRVDKPIGFFKKNGVYKRILILSIKQALLLHLLFSDNQEALAVMQFPR